VAAAEAIAPALAVTVLIPVYNEAGSMRGMAARLGAVLDALPAGSEAIVVDDGSTDGSGEALASDLPGQPRIRLLRHERNRGYGAALKTGVRAATTPLVAIADADGTYPWSVIPRLAQDIEAGAAMAVGARRLSDQPAIRRPAKAFLNRYASWLADSPIPDINSGLRVFRREDARRLERLLPEAFSYTSTITLALLGEGERVDYRPIRYRQRVGQSKIRPLRDTGRFLLLLARMALLFNPLRVFGAASAVMLGAGGLLLLGRLVSAHEFGVATTIVLLVGGVQLFAVGLLADLVNRRLG
jgi:glycosyltransferase involved in cell wall biosynthesis